MADAPEPSLDEHLWTIAAARILLPAARARPGAAEPRLRRVPAPARRGHRRLGRRLARDDRPRQPGGAVAGRRAAPRGDPVARPRARAAAARLSRVSGRDVARASGARPGARASPTRSGSPARTAGRRATPERIPFVVRRDALPVDTPDELGEDELVRLLRARGEERQRVFAAADRAPARGQRRRGDVRRHAQRPVHERLLLPLRLLRVLEGQARREPARARLPRPARRDRAPRRARRGTAAPPRSACRAASTRPSPASTTSTSCRTVKERRAGDPRARVLRARDLAGRGHARPGARAVPGAPPRRRASARCRGRRPRSSTTRCGASSVPTR